VYLQFKDLFFVLMSSFRFNVPVKTKTITNISLSYNEYGIDKEYLNKYMYHLNRQLKGKLF